MSPIEPTGASALARGSPHHTQISFSARSAADRASAIQAHATAAAAAPVETVQAVPQAQTTQKPRLRAEPSPTVDAAVPATTSRPGSTVLSKPMTAVLLHELRLQQELADVQEEKQKKQP
ncbi:hypothetical protein [Marimonas arenosa]|uniref:Uncharacterized protein n=1 Tax=Marimonas arenosa TaxID=1795305 RepID=A0AAE4B4U1_9RHOB|nr:hypothetical protein [Marimonas arenosa]MDQ2091398.1 hypothetical protein [Marimonas arenosa]